MRTAFAGTDRIDTVDRVHRLVRAPAWWPTARGECRAAIHGWSQYGKAKQGLYTCRVARGGQHHCAAHLDPAAVFEARPRPGQAGRVRLKSQASQQRPVELLDREDA